METVQVRALTFPRPEDYHILDEAERAKLRFAEEGEGVCLSAPEKHILISLACVQVGPLLPRLLGSREIAAHAAKKIEKPMSLLDYKAGPLLRRSVGGQSAEGFSYTYTAQDIPMYGETLVVRGGRVLYYLHLYARQALQRESVDEWVRLLGDAAWE